MKLFLYSLAAILFCGLAVKLIAELPPIYGSTGQKSTAVVAQRMVYVDTARLMKMHPSRDAAREMERMLAKVDAVVNAKLPDDVITEKAFSNVPVTRTESVSRKVLEAEAANKAVSSLDELDMQKQTALAARVKSMRETMMKSAESDINAQVRDIDEATSNSNRAVDESYKMDRLNAQLKASALRVQTKVTGIDQDAVKTKLKAIEQSISEMDKSSDTKKNQLKKKSGEQINALRIVAAKKIEDKIRAYENQENVKIASDKAEAQEQIVREIGLFGRLVPGSESVAINSAKTPKTANLNIENSFGNNNKVSDLHMAALELNTRIREDINRAVLELAAEKGIKVTFKRGGAGIPDATEMFAEWLHEREWSSNESAMNGRGS